MTFPKNRITKVVSWLAGLTGGERERERERAREATICKFYLLLRFEKIFPKRGGACRLPEKMTTRNSHENQREGGSGRGIIAVKHFG